MVAFALTLLLAAALGIGVGALVWRSFLGAWRSALIRRLVFNPELVER